MPWMNVDLNYNSANGRGTNWLGIPGILYNQNNQVIDTATKFAAYLDYLGIVVDGNNIGWWNPCTQLAESLTKQFFGWIGTDFAIYPGQGMSIAITSDCVLPLRFGQGYVKRLICTETVAKYCEWLGQEEFDSLEG